MSSQNLQQPNPLTQPLSRDYARIYNVQIQVQNKKRSTGWPLLPTTDWCTIESFTITNQQHKPLQYRVDKLQDENQLKLLVQDKDYFVNFSARTFSSHLNTSMACTIPWPQEWDETTSMYLHPSRYIQSGDPIFKKAVGMNGNPRSVPIHIAAKVLIRYCLQNISSDGQYTKGKMNSITGINVRGALHAVREGTGSATDVVCVCIATLRAAGIPARPVVGITNANIVGNSRVEPHYMVWGEYALPGAGWVPFVPKRMRGTVNNLSTTEPWQGLGTLQWLNRRIPIAYNFNMYDIDRAIQYLQMTFLSSLQ